MTYLSQVSEFCDKDHSDTPSHLKHDSEALNEQNVYCNGRSSWEVMKEHEDFKNGNVSRAYSISWYPSSVRGLSSTFSNGHEVDSFYISHIASTGGDTNSCVFVSWVRSDKNSGLRITMLS